MENNIKKFDKLVALILAELYRKFPVRSHVDIYHVFECTEQGGVDDEGVWREPSDLSEDDRQFYCDTIKWLIDTGYVIGTIEHHNSSSVTLSIKGLQLLKSVPSSLDSSDTLGEQLLSFLKSGAKDAAGQLISSALSLDNLLTRVGNLLSSAQ
ncbi:hypothetical protein [Aeromonas veronii]|uniref:hypothetical protein n=1 Tax=Aeromonas veronii TaxID=654 RepID=UPI001115BBF0|nr:hypothetical protein [Aeromonas veronii]